MNQIGVALFATFGFIYLNERLKTPCELSPVYTDMRFFHALTHAISDLNEGQDQIGSI